MKAFFILALVLLMVVSAVLVSAASLDDQGITTTQNPETISKLPYAMEYEHGVFAAWFNDIPLSTDELKDISLKIGEPAKIVVTIVAKKDSPVKDVIMLSGTTIIKPYNVISGPGFTAEYNKIPAGVKYIPISLDAGEAKTFTWIITPNGAWTGCPDQWKTTTISLGLQSGINKESGSGKVFTKLISPCILNEKYTGPIPAPQTSGTAETPKTDSKQSQSNTQPFPYIYLVLVGAVVIVVLVLFKIRKK